MNALATSKIYVLSIPSYLSTTWQIQALQLLDAQERWRYRHYPPNRQKQFLLGRWLLKNCLASHLKCQAKDILIGISKNGKPYVKRPLTRHKLHISVTHTHNMIACSLSNCQHGIDIESLNRAPKNERRLSRLLNKHVESQILSLCELTHYSRAHLFITFWCYFESFIKLKGSRLHQEKEAFFSGGQINPNNLAARADHVFFHSHQLYNDIIGFGYKPRLIQAKPEYVHVQFGKNHVLSAS